MAAPGIAAIGGATGPVPSPPAECPKSKRVDRPGDHSWRFMGDDPYTECVWCGEIRDALSGRIVRAGRR